MNAVDALRKNPNDRQSLLQVETLAPILPADPLPAPIPADLPEKTWVLRYSIFYRIPIYLLVAFTLFIGLQALLKADGPVVGVFGIFLLVLLIPLWFVSAAVRLDGSGLRLRRLFGLVRSEVYWDEIEACRPRPIGSGMNVVASGGTRLHLSSQLRGYPALIEALRGHRPDLFQSTQDRQTFRKNGVTKYGPLALLIPSPLILIATLVTGQILIALVVAVILFLMWRSALRTPYQVTLEGDRLSMEGLRRKQAWTAGQVKDIRLATLYHRWGLARHEVQLELLDGESIWLAGFPGGDELLYGYLRNWWDTYRKP